MAVVHDLICKRCQKVTPGQLVDVGKYGTCECGGARTWMPSKLSSDVFGSEQYSDAAGRSFTSQREKENYMRDRGYQIAGDPVGGARYEHGINGTAFSYAGQGAKTSTAERGH